METKREGFFTYHKLSEKERKNLIILDLIKRKGPISRTEISRMTDINIVSVSNYIKDYLDKGLIFEKGFEASSGGRRPELVELNKESINVIGVDVNITETRAVLTNLAMDVAKKVRIRNTSRNREEIIKNVISLIESLLADSKVEIQNIKAIGISISDADLFGLRDDVGKKFDVPTFAGTDAACAAFGEKTLNPQADVSDLLYMHSDVGCGIIIRGDIYFGAGGSAGEMQISGSQVSREEEAVLSRDAKYLRPWGPYLGIINSAKREIERGIGTKMVAIAKGEISNVTKEVVIEAAKQNDEVALYIIQTAAMNLGLRTAYLVNLFNPEVVVIGGGIEKAGPLIMRPIMDKVKKFAFSAQADIVKIISSALGEEAVSLGTASLAVREIFLKA